MGGSFLSHMATLVAVLYVAKLSVSSCGFMLDVSVAKTLQRMHEGREIEF